MVAVVLGIDNTRNVGNGTRLRLMKLLPTLLMLSIPKTTANFAIIILINNNKSIHIKSAACKG